MPAPNKRPTSVLVAAVLLIVIGGFKLFTGCCGGLGLAMMMSGAFDAINRQNPGGNPAMDVEKQIAQRLPLYQPITFGSVAVTFLAGAALLAAGIGLLRLRPWSRPLALAVLVLAIVDLIGMNLYQALVVNPLRAELMGPVFNQMPQMRGITEMAQYFGYAVGVLYLGVMVALVVLLLRPAVRDALNAPEGVGDDDEPDEPRRPRDRYGDEDDDRPPPSTGIKEM